LENGDDEAALKFYRETLEVERAALGPDHADVVMTLQNLAQLHHQRGELDQALMYFREALSIQQASLDANDVTIAQTLNHIGNVYLQRGDAKQLVEVFSAAIRIIRNAGRSESELVVSGFNFYGLSKLHPECAPMA
jgi:tetratricopeptide (TPR) repeat protein